MTEKRCVLPTEITDCELGYVSMYVYKNVCYILTNLHDLQYKLNVLQAGLCFKYIKIFFMNIN